MNQALHQKLVQLHIRASEWLDGECREGFEPWHGICHHLTLNPSDSDRLTALMAQWPGSSGDAGYPVPHPTMEPEEAFEDATQEEMWSPEFEYARNRLALLNWLIEQTAPRLPYVVVTGPGTALEQMIGEFATFSEALACAKHNRDWCDADVMKRLPDGSLTTEF